MKLVLSLRTYCSLRSLRLALVSCCLPHSLADGKHVCSLARPGQQRASLLSSAARDSVFDCSLRSLRFALGSRLVRRRLRTEERVRSLLLTTAARETQRSQLSVHSPATRTGG
jgi:hypothetical protein